MRNSTDFVGFRDMFCTVRQINERATAICHRAGKPTLVHGDVFIGRFFDNDDAFFRMDFRLADLKDDAPFFAQAYADNKVSRARFESVIPEWA
jgi:hypothetical protein